jgi:DNA transformation protein
VNSRDFIEHVLELARSAGRPNARAMFGGHGIYLDGRIVAIVVDDVLYLKSDADCAARFEQRDLAPFVYVTKDGERIAMSYRLAPDEALESAEQMREWMRLAQGLRCGLPRESRRGGRGRVPDASTRADRGIDDPSVDDTRDQRVLRPRTLSTRYKAC